MHGYVCMLIKCELLNVNHSLLMCVTNVCWCVVLYTYIIWSIDLLILILINWYECEWGCWWGDENRRQNGTTMEKWSRAYRELLLSSAHIPLKGLRVTAKKLLPTTHAERNPFISTSSTAAKEETRLFSVHFFPHRHCSPRQRHRPHGSADKIITPTNSTHTNTRPLRGQREKRQQFCP